ncbi:MAG: lipocalin family protein, partial [Parvularculaceae bacterium]|nr:lipocalin family protein [Parvularculaceae bacterium]
YWILWRAEDYSISLVGEPSGRYLWILSRTPTLSDEARAEALSRLTQMGYDVTKLYFPQQPPAAE